MNSLSECILWSRTMLCVHEFSLRMHTLVSNHASPASKLCSQDMRIACSARMCGRPAAAPYPGLRPSAVRQCERGRPAAVHCPGVRPCKRGEPAAVPYPGVRPRKRGRPAAVPYPGLRPCERGRPAAVHAPASGRVSAASLRPYLIPATCCTGLLLRKGGVKRTTTKMSVS